jgi:hypothetical protein
MITLEERDELEEKAKEDGKRFYQVVEGIYKFLVFANWVVGLVGAVVGLSILRGNLTAAILCIIITAICCIGIYVFSVLVTHAAKVLVHILFSNLAIMEAAHHESLQE